MKSKFCYRKIQLILHNTENQFAQEPSLLVPTKIVTDPINSLIIVNIFTFLYSIFSSSVTKMKADAKQKENNAKNVVYFKR